MLRPLVTASYWPNAVTPNQASWKLELCLFVCFMLKLLSYLLFSILDFG